MLNFVTDYWFLLLIGVVCIAVLGYKIYTFVKQPSQTQILKIKEWLLWAVAAAEKEFGSGTGELKLRYVYNLFLSKFSSLAKLISFEDFKNLVKEALEEFEDILNKYPSIQDYIEE